MKSYSTYRGQSPWKRALKILVVVLLLLAALAVAAYLYLQQYLVYSDDGIRLELPFLREEPEPTPTPTPTPAPTLPVVVVTPSPTPEPVIVIDEPVPLSFEALYDGTAADQVAAAGGDCALFDMKGDDGKLYYLSELEQAQRAKLSPEDRALNAAIRALNQEEGLYTVARVSCFKDNTITRFYPGYAILTNSGYHWTDPAGLFWSSPTSDDVQAYLTEICVELARLGFDEILLDNAGYPDQGNLHYIRKGTAYDATQFSAVIGAFYDRVAAALAGYDVKFSIVTTAQALDGTDELTGQTPENMAAADRLWVWNEDGGLVLVKDD